MQKTPLLLRSLFAIGSSILLCGAAFTQSGNVVDETEFRGVVSGSFGESFACLGDINGDGIVEVAVGDPLDSDGGATRGAVWIQSVQPDGSLTPLGKISDTQGGLGAVLDDCDQFGIALEHLGDLNGDGVPDLAVGVAGDDDFASGAGAVYILFLKADSTVSSFQKISGTMGGMEGQLAFGDAFGSSIANLGDVDGDGVTDIAVGAKFTDSPSGGSNIGVVYILFLNRQGTAKATQIIADAQGGFDGVLNLGDHFGSGLAATDSNADGLPELAIGASGDDDGAAVAGAIWIVHLDSAGLVVFNNKISETSGGFVGDLDVLDQLGGGGLEFLPDLDGDGLSELAAGVFNDSDGGPASGCVYMLMGASSGVVKQTIKHSPAEGTLLSRIPALSMFGAGMCSPGDLDGDGSYDLLVGAPGINDLGGGVTLFLSDGNPAAAFSLKPEVQCREDPVVFTDLSSGHGLSAWSWDFGDGSTSTLASPTHVYSQIGTYVVVLEVVGSGGRGRTVLRDTLMIIELFDVEFSAPDTSGLPPLTVQFSDETTGAPATWLWDFGDGQSSTLQNPTHLYPSIGGFDVSLTVTDESGLCIVTERKDAFVAAVGVDVANGTNINPLILSSGSDPFLGTTWQVDLDASGLGAGGLTFLIGYEEALTPGIVLGVGELLVDPFSSQVLLNLQSLAGEIAQHNIGISSDLALFGFELSVQEFLINVAGSTLLTNALNVTLGTP